MSKDYTDLGLNNNLMSTTALQNKSNNFISSFELDALSDTNTITGRQAGLISLLNAGADNYSYLSEPWRSTTSTSFVDVENTTINFSLRKRSRVLIYWGATMYLTFNNNNTPSFAQVTLNLDGTDEVSSPENPSLFSIRIYDDSVNNYAGRTHSHTAIGYKDLESGNHTMKLRFRFVDGPAGNGIEIHVSDIGYLVLGS